MRKFRQDCDSKSVADQAPAAETSAAQPDDEALLRRYAKTGDAEAFQELVERYQKLVWSASRRVLGDSSDAEDAVQSVFLALAKSAATIETNVAAWLHSTAVNISNSLARSDLARRKREQQHVDNLVTEADERAWKEMRDVIDVCLGELGDDDRELVIQRFYRGMTQAEIGKQLGIGQQAVAARLEKIVERLRRGLKRRGLPVSAAAVTGALSAGLAEASAPASLTATLAKIGISGIGYAKPAAAFGAVSLLKGTVSTVSISLCLLAAWWYFWRPSDAGLASVITQFDTARTIQYSKTRTNGANGQTEEIQPQDVLDREVQRYQVLDGYLERVEDLDQDGSVIRVMIGNYRTDEVLMLDMRAKTYTTNVRLKRQQRDAPNPVGLSKLAPQTDLAEQLASFPSGATETITAQNEEGRDAVGYQTESKQQNSVWRRTLWANPQSNRPLRTVETFRNDQPGVGASDWVCDHFVFDAEIPRSLFSTNPPEGFRPHHILRYPGEAAMPSIPIP